MDFLFRDKRSGNNRRPKSWDKVDKHFFIVGQQVLSNIISKELPPFTRSKRSDSHVIQSNPCGRYQYNSEKPEI